jgi:hypothetical protein
MGIWGTGWRYDKRLLEGRWQLGLLLIHTVIFLGIYLVASGHLQLVCVFVGRAGQGPQGRG